MIKQLIATISLAVSLTANSLSNNSDYQNWNVTYLAKKKSFKNAIERAVYKASPLPKAPIKSVFDREILFHFRVN